MNILEISELDPEIPIKIVHNYFPLYIHCDILNWRQQKGINLPLLAGVWPWPRPSVLPHNGDKDATMISYTAVQYSVYESEEECPKECNNLFTFSLFCRKCVMIRVAWNILRMTATRDDGNYSQKYPKVILLWSFGLVE